MTTQAGGRRRLARPELTTVAVAAAAAAFLGTVVAAIVRALADDWYPVGDNAYFALRSRDVLTEHHPLLGTWTSASQTVGFDLNNPGPLLFDALALPAKVDPTLLPIGTALIVIGSVLAMAACAARVAGRRGVLAVLFAASGLAWAMGPELLIDPWQPHALLFPFLAFIGATWATWAGSDGSVAAVTALGSFVVQSHMSYGPLVALLGGSAITAVVVRAVPRGPRRGRATWALGLALVVGLVLWAQPLVEQVTANERGNLSRITDLAGAETEEAVGPELGVRVAGTLLAPVPRWTPPSFEEAYENVSYEPAPPPVFERVLSTPIAAVALLGTMVALAVVGGVARRRGASALQLAAVVVGLTVVGALLSTMALPIGIYGLPAHHIRWLWPVAIAVTTVLVAGALARRAGVVLVTVAAVAMTAFAVVPTHPEIGPTADDDSAPVIRALAPQLDALRGRGPLLLELEGLRLFEPYSIAIALELDQRGVEIHVEDPGMVRQLGPARAATGDEDGRVFVWQGELGEEGRPGLERVAYVAGLDGQEARELDDRTAELGSWLTAGEVRLTELGQRAVRSGRIPDLTAAMASGAEPFAAVAVDSFRAAAEDGFLAAPGREQDLDRWVELRRRFVRQTVGVWIGPGT